MEEISPWSHARLILTLKKKISSSKRATIMNYIKHQNCVDIIYLMVGNTVFVLQYLLEKNLQSSIEVTDSRIEY